MKILLLEKDQYLAQLLSYGLQRNDFCVDVLACAGDSLRKMQSSSYDIFVIDRYFFENFQDEVCTIRIMFPEVAIVIIGGHMHVEDTEFCFENGVDECLKKPFSLRMLLMKLRRLTKYYEKHPSLECTKYIVDTLIVDECARQVERSSRRILLQTKEFRLLLFLVKHQNQVLTRRYILEHVWQNGYDVCEGIVDTYISRLRKKVDVEGEVSLIHTVYGEGFRFGAVV